MISQRTMRQRRKSSVTLMLALVSQLFLQTAALAQTDQGRVVGTVRDQTSAIIPGATIVIKNERTGEVRTINASEQGQYLITALRPSFYTLKATAAGFASAEFTSLQLSVGQELTLDIDLKPAGASESITVVGNQEATIDASSARIGANVNQREVEGLPVNGR
jgi:Carboxypeptidase regulatory-like domain